ncbi:MAG: HAMP domain-containing histidine kinase [Bacteroides sp.]|nr:HAMP domain-containing histidine kinase [Bacteroides sp.]
MKLFDYIYRNLALGLFFLFVFWGILFYATIRHQFMQEIDDTLDNYRSLLIRRALRDPAIVERHQDGFPFYEFRPLSNREAVMYEEDYYDTQMYIEEEGEWEPVRVLRCCFRMPDLGFYELTVSISTLKKNDMIETLFWNLFLLFVCMLFFVIAGTHLLLKRSLRPLQKLIAWVEEIVPGKNIQPFESDTRIREFQKLNEVVMESNRRSHKLYEDQKQFIENASHELQTPLAIARGKIELLAEQETLTEEQMMEIDEVYQTLGRAIKLNRSLLLLSRIENRQFPEVQEICLNETIDALLPDLTEVYAMRKLRAERLEEGRFCCSCNPWLAQILVSNLLKNAMIHTPVGGELHIRITDREVCIRNSGGSPLDKEKIFSRFYHNSLASQGSTGLGLPIALSIAETYDLSLQYFWEEGRHLFCIRKKEE